MKRFLLLAAFTTLSLLSYAQKTINNPLYGSRTSDALKINKIEITDTSTNLYFEIKYFPKGWIKMNDKSFIQSSNGGEKLYMKSAQGMPFKLNEKYKMPESGEVSFSMSYPRISDTIAKIDFIEAPESNWKIFDIEIIPQTPKLAIPSELAGNWLKADGSNQWVLGLFKDIALYKNDFWDYSNIEKKGNYFEVTLIKNFKTLRLLLKPAKKGLVTIGENENQLALCTRNKINDKAYRVPVGDALGEVQFKSDTAIYRGFIHGYSPKMGFKTGVIYVNDVFKADQINVTFFINKNGTFEVKAPLSFMLDVMVRVGPYNSSIYLEPGKTTMQYINANEFIKSYRTREEYDKRERLFLFMGSLADINTEMVAADTIQYFNYDEMQKKVLDMSPLQYKSDLKVVLDKEHTAIDELARNGLISKKAQQLAHLKSDIRYATTVLEYNSKREYAYRRKNKIPNNQREIPLKNVELDTAYYREVIPYVNNPLSIYNSGYYFLINRIKYADIITQSGTHTQKILFTDIVNGLKSKGVVLTAVEEQLITDMSKTDTSRAYVESIQKRTKAFNEKYKEKLRILQKSTSYEAKRLNSAKEIFGCTDLVIDILKAQDYSNSLERSFTPFSQEEVEYLQTDIKNSYIIGYLLNLSKKVEKKIAENKLKTDYKVNETPKTEADKLFDAMMAKYSGKVVYVDFWATWCGPCRSGIQKIKPLKEEMKNDSVVFVYITNQSSPEETWKNAIPDISGEHFRVSQDEWNILKSKFEITGIPHYALVDKKGQVTNLKFHSRDNESIKTLLKQELEKK